MFPIIEALRFETKFSDGLNLNYLALFLRDDPDDDMSRISILKEVFTVTNVQFLLLRYQ